MAPHRSSTRGLVVLAALVAALAMAAATPAAAAKPATGAASDPTTRARQDRFRFMRARAGFSSPKALLDTLSSTPVGKWHLGDAKDALDMLRHVFTLENGDHVDTSAAFWAEAQTKNKGGKDLSSKHADNEAKALFTYIKRLRKRFRGAEGTKKVLIRGAGPAGLSAALYAKLKIVGLRSKTVHVVDNRGDYTRMHPVTLKKKKTLASCNSYGTTTITGASSLLHGGLGADKLQPYFYPYTPNNDDPKIPTYKLEYHLALAAHIVGVTFEYGAVADMPDDKSKAQELSSFKSDKNGQGKWKAITNRAVDAKCPAVLPDVAEDRQQFATGEDCGHYDVVIAADGVSSHTRRFSPCFKSSGTSPGWGLVKFHASDEGTATTEQKVSSLIEEKGGLPSLAFVMKEDAGLTMRALPEGTYINYPELRKGFFEKLGMTEVALNIAPGNRFLNAFTRKCSFNYNVKSTTQATDNDLSDLRLVFHVFSNLVSVKPNGSEEATNKKRYTEALKLFKKVQEFKVWVTNFNAATHADAGAKKVYVGRAYGDANAKAAMIIGDAAREALPDDGMGANDAHHTAMLAIQAAAKLGTTKFDAKLKALRKHTTNVAALIQCKSAASYAALGTCSTGHPLLEHSNLKFSEDGRSISFAEGEY